MGLADEITIINPVEFKNFVKDKIKKQKLV
jgi:hypothetical protein